MCALFLYYFLFHSLNLSPYPSLSFFSVILCSFLSLFFLFNFSSLMFPHVGPVFAEGVCVYVTEMTVINLDYVKRDEGCEQRTTVRDTKQSEPSTVLLNTCLRHLSSSITARAACVLDVTEQTLFIKLSCDVTERP